MLETAVPVEHGLTDQLLAGKARLDSGERSGGKKLFQSPDAEAIHAGLKPGGDLVRPTAVLGGQRRVHQEKGMRDMARSQNS